MPSTVIKFFTYDAAKHELRVVFQSGRRYSYQQVPQKTFEALQAASSKGAYFNAHIRGRFGFVRAPPAGS